ncbi:MAG: formimidoylglutamate deiminase [Planctomycetota bacterium]|jgi:formimidoylglutamate deiminase
MATRQIIQPDLTWTGDGFERGAQIVIDAQGRIGSVGGARAGGPRKTGVRRMPGRAVLPGMVNAHCVAFQRGLRGLGERFPKGQGSFWSWRERMYELVESMDEQTMYELSRSAYEEMLRAGITTVGEFHYLHHDASGADYDLDDAVLRAASDTGIRVVLLQVYYRTGGIGQELEGGQLRFQTKALAEYWQRLDELSEGLDTAVQSLGVAAHSIRAVPPDDLVALHEQAEQRRLVFHMHVEEQSAEVKACEAALGARPMALLNERLNINDRFTAVHCTHTATEDMETFAGAGGNVCLCPLTEANHGDGIPDVGAILGSGGHICLGTDSNVRICFAEEMRWLEYGQRLAQQQRGVYVDGRGHCARALWEAATVNGARSLGVNAGRMQRGCAADLIALDLEHPTLAGWTDETLLDALVFGSSPEAVAEVCVNGRWIE